MEHHRPADLARLIHPRSIALVGASARAGSIGERTLTNLLTHSELPPPPHLLNPTPPPPPHPAPASRPGRPAVSGQPEPARTARPALLAQRRGAAGHARCGGGCSARQRRARG